jgi:hypothetical protein
MSNKKIGSLYWVTQHTIYWKYYYKLLGNPFIHYHVCYKYLTRILKGGPRFERIIDFGSGDGSYLNQLSFDSNSEGLGIDSMQNRLDLATQIAKHYNIRNRFIKGDITEKLNMESKFDCGICLDVLEHIEDEKVEGLFRNFAEWILDGGTLVIRVPHDKDAKYLKKAQVFTYGEDSHCKTGYTIEELTTLLKNAGFEVDSVIYHYFFMSQLNYEISEQVRKSSKFLYSIYSAMFRWLSFLEIYSPLLSIGRANGILVVAKKKI